jgi:hypothetical protein
MRKILKISIVFGVLATAVIPFVTGCNGKAVESRAVMFGTTHVTGLVYALPRTLIELELSLKSGNLTFNAAAINVADPAERFSLRHNISAAYGDDLNIAVDAKGLLVTAKSTVIDQSPAILQAIAQSAGDASALSGDEQVSSSDKACGLTDDFSFKQIIDPFAPNDIARLNATLASEKTGCKIAFREPFAAIAGAEPATVSTVRPQNDCASSYCFRLPAPMIVELTKADDDSVLLSSRVVTVADPRITGHFDITRQACSNDVTNLVFTEGLLTSMVITKPSSILKCVGIPSSVIAAFFSGFAATLTQRSGIIKSRAELYEEELKLLKAEAALTDARLKAIEGAGQ